MSKVETEVTVMAHLATEVDKCRPIDRQRVAELVRSGIALERALGSEVADRVCAWLTVRGKADTDEALHTQELRRKAKTEGTPPTDPPTPPAGPPATDDPPTGQTGLPLADCDEPGHVGCERDDALGGDAINHHLAAAGA